MECLIDLGSGIDRLHLVYYWVVPDCRIRSGYLDFVALALHISGLECHVTQRQIEPNPKHEVQRCRCILQCFLVASDATGDVNRRDNGVFDISQKLFLSVKSCPGLENIRLVGCFGFNGPLRQYFSLYRAVSQREGEREEKG